MAQDRVAVLMETVTRLYRKQSLPHLENLLNKTTEVELLALFRQMGVEESAKILHLLPRGRAGRILRGLPVEQQINIVGQAEVRDILPILEELPSEDVNRIMSRLEGGRFNPLKAAFAIRQQPAQMVDDRMMGEASEENGTEASEPYPAEAAEKGTETPSRSGSSPLNPEKAQMLVETIDRLYAKKANRTIQKIFAKAYPADLAAAFEMLSKENVTDIFMLIPDRDQGARVLGELREELQEKILNEADAHAILPILERLAPDNRADLISHLDKELGSRLMDGLDKETKSEVENLLQYPPESAGGLMTSQYFALPEETLVSEAIAAVRTLPTYEMVFYLYVVDDSGLLTGVSSLRQLLLANPNSALKDMMNTRVVKIHTHAPQQDVAELARHYRLLGVPVVDEMGVMVGLITVDDLFPVLEEGMTEDMLKMAGTHSDEIDAESSLPIVRIRLPWLLLVFLGGILAAGIISHFQQAVVDLVSLIFFLPVVMALAGNAGTQSATVVVRGLSTGAIKTSEFGKVLLREMLAGVMVGCVGGGLLGVVAYLLFNNFDLAQVVSTAVALNVPLATLIATAVPMMLEKKGGDPTSLTGPLLTTLIDIVGIASYFWLAQYFVE